MILAKIIPFYKNAYLHKKSTAKIVKKYRSTQVCEPQFCELIHFLVKWLWFVRKSRVVRITYRGATLTHAISTINNKLV